MNGTDSIRTTLINSLKRRFSNVIDFDSNTFDSKYIVSTVADPRTACALNEEESRLLAVSKDMVCYNGS